MSETETTSPSERIAQAFSPANLRELGHRLIDLLSGHLAKVESSSERVLNWNEPSENIARAAQILDAAPKELPPAEELANRFEALAAEMLGRGHNLHDPRKPVRLRINGLANAMSVLAIRHDSL